MSKLLIVEPAFYGEGIVQAAYRAHLPLLLFAKKNERVQELKQLYPDAEVNQADTTSAQSMAKQLATRQDVGGVTSGTEWLQPIVGELIDMTGLNGPISQRTGTLARYKDEMRAAFARHGVAQPKFRAAKTLAEAKSAARQIGYPCIFKPSHLGGSWCVRLVHNDQDVELAYETMMTIHPPDPFNNDFDLGRSAMVLEEFVEGKEVSIESISIDGEVKFVSVTEKFNTGAPKFIEHGHVTPPRELPIEISTLLAFNEEVLNALEIKNGPSHCEVLITADGPKVVECACRNGGDNIMKLVHAAYGVDMLEATALIALGQKPNVEAVLESAAAVLFITPPPGRSKIVYDESEVTKAFGCIEYKLVPAQTVLTSNGQEDIMDRVGYVICSAKTAQQARENSLAWAELIRFES